MLSPRLLAVAIALLSCGARGKSFSCSPTPSCSLAPERFEPPPLEIRDAGPSGCDLDAGSCPAEQIAAGRAFTCAMAPSGPVLCWGDDTEGQLGGSIYPGDGLDAGVRYRFVVGDAVAITAGDAHACALHAFGEVSCWGRNREGQVDGTASDPVTSSVLVGDVTASAISAGGAHTCAIVDDGVSCWGSARFGQVGHEVADVARPPEVVPGTTGAIAVSAGTRHTCALFADGHVSCWGERYDADADALVADAEPTDVPGLDDAIDVAAGAGFSCALRDGGGVACWGDNGSGALGDDTKTSSATPVTVEGLDVALDVAAGGADLDGTLVGHACAINRSFFIQCWGRNAEGQLAQPEARDYPRAITVRGEEGEEEDEPYLPDVTEVTAGGFHTCSIDHDGPVLCWGEDRAGQLGANERAAFGHPVEAHPFRGEY